MQRAPAGLHGEWWRTFTTLFAQDGGVAGTISNLAFLLVIEAEAEPVLEPRLWLTASSAALVAGLAIAVVLAVSDRPARHMIPHRHG